MRRKDVESIIYERWWWKINERQRKFADEYIISGNMYQSAINAGYSENYAKAQSHKLLENVGIKSYLEERMKEISDKSIADQTEVMQYLTRLMRGEETETEMMNVGNFEQELVEVPVKHNIRKQAAELIGKRYALLTDKLDAKVDNNIKITLGDYDGDD